MACKNRLTRPTICWYKVFAPADLFLDKEVPHGFAQLPDPYDPVANDIYRVSPPYLMHDLSYYKGRLYLYFGATPVLMLFWPYTRLTGEYLSYRQAVTMFCSIGFLATVSLLCAVWRRYFAEVGVGVVVACVVALGFAVGTPAQLTQASFYQVPRTCGYMLTMLTLGGIWCALHDAKRRWLWLAAASVAYGLALGARPNLLPGAVILLLPVIQVWGERKRAWHALAAAIVPIALIWCGLMLYNELRFDNPLEFGWHYQLHEERQITRQPLNPRFLWFNFRSIFWREPAGVLGSPSCTRAQRHHCQWAMMPWRDPSAYWPTFPWRGWHWWRRSRGGVGRARRNRTCAGL